MDHLISLKEWSPEKIRQVLDLARDVKAKPATYHNAMAHKTLLMIFEKPSLRTRLSFESAKQASTSAFGGLPRNGPSAREVVTPSHHNRGIHEQEESNEPWYCPGANAADRHRQHTDAVRQQLSD